jgi:hypothetical protein
MYYITSRLVLKSELGLDYKGFWRYIVTDKITGVVVFVQHPEYLENTRFRKLELFPSSDDFKEAPTLLGSLDTIVLNHGPCLKNVLLSN